MLNEPEHRQSVINEREKLWFRSMESKGRWRIRVCLISICCYPHDSKARQTVKGKADALKLEFLHSHGCTFLVSGWKLQCKRWNRDLLLFVLRKAYSSRQCSLNLIFFVFFQIPFFSPSLFTFMHLSHPPTKLNYQFIRLTNGIIYQLYPIISYNLSSLLCVNTCRICTYCLICRKCHY